MTRARPSTAPEGQRLVDPGGPGLTERTSALISRYDAYARGRRRQAPGGGHSAGGIPHVNGALTIGRTLVTWVAWFAQPSRPTPWPWPTPASPQWMSSCHRQAHRPAALLLLLGTVWRSKSRPDYARLLLTVDRARRRSSVVTESCAMWMPSTRPSRWIPTTPCGCHQTSGSLFGKRPGRPDSKPQGSNSCLT